MTRRRITWVFVGSLIGLLAVAIVGVLGALQPPSVCSRPGWARW